MGDIILCLNKGEGKNHLVALKILKPHLKSNFKVVKRFLAGAEIMKSLSKNNDDIIKVYDICKDDSILPFFTMEYFPNAKSISNILYSKKIDFSKKFDFFFRIIRTISFAHRENVVHRDIKPDNILSNENIIKITDFDLAHDSELTRYTQNTEFGTFLYRAPDQKKIPDKFLYTLDVYSLGVILYGLILGREPFQDEIINKSKLRQNVYRKLATVVANPVLIADIITTSLDSNYKNRYENAELLYKAFGNLEHYVVPYNKNENGNSIFTTSDFTNLWELISKRSSYFNLKNTASTEYFKSLVRFLTITESPYIFFDFEGTFENCFINYIPKSNTNNCHFIDFSNNKYVPGINPFSIVSQNISNKNELSVLCDIIANCADINTTSQKKILYSLIQILSNSYNTSLLSIIRIMSDAGYAASLLKQIKNPILSKNLNSILSSQGYHKNQLSILLNKIYSLLSNKYFSNIISQVREMLTISFFINKGKIVYFNLSSRNLTKEHISCIFEFLLFEIYYNRDKIETKGKSQIFISGFDQLKSSSILRFLNLLKKDIAFHLIGQHSEAVSNSKYVSENFVLFEEDKDNETSDNDDILYLKVLGSNKIYKNIHFGINTPSDIDYQQKSIIKEISGERFCIKSDVIDDKITRFLNLLPEDTTIKEKDISSDLNIAAKTTDPYLLLDILAKISYSLEHYPSYEKILIHRMKNSVDRDDIKECVNLLISHLKNMRKFDNALSHMFFLLSKTNHSKDSKDVIDFIIDHITKLLTYNIEDDNEKCEYAKKCIAFIDTNNLSEYEEIKLKRNYLLGFVNLQSALSDWRDFIQESNDVIHLVKFGTWLKDIAGNKRRAEKCYRKAIKFDQNCFLAYNNLIILLLKKAEKSPSLSLLDEIGELIQKANKISDRGSLNKFFQNNILTYKNLKRYQKV